MGIIKTENLSFDYIRMDEEDNVIDVNRAVDDVNLDFNEGEFIAVLGHNGSGKSTFAKHLNAILLPTEGTVWVNGYNTKDASSTWKIRENTGMVFQNPDNQIIGNVVEEDVAFGPENLGVPTEKIIARVKEALANVGMTKYAKHSPNKLSGGQKQRVAIAGIMAMHPKCIVLDEPTAMLDPEGRKEVLDTVQKLNKEEKITVILITHYMEEIVNADRVFVMDKGKVVITGTPREIFAKPKELAEHRLTIPAITALGYEIKKNVPEFPTPVLTLEEFLEAVDATAKIDNL